MNSGLLGRPLFTFTPCSQLALFTISPCFQLLWSAICPFIRFFFLWYDFLSEKEEEPSFCLYSILDRFLLVVGSRTALPIFLRLRLFSEIFIGWDFRAYSCLFFQCAVPVRVCYLDFHCLFAPVLAILGAFPLATFTSFPCRELSALLMTKKIGDLP